jgi:hypothetical protein
MKPENPHNPYAAPGGQSSIVEYGNSMSYLLMGLEKIDGALPANPTIYSVAPKSMWDFLQTGNSCKYFEALLIPDVIHNPIGIWQGLERDGADEFYCLAGQPDGTYAGQSGLRDQISVYNHLVFLIFANKEFVISKWRWEEPDSDGSGFPTSHNTRFRNLIWPR